MKLLIKLWLLLWCASFLVAQQVTISPMAIQVNAPNQQIIFTTNTAHPVWSVIGLGTVSPSGVYTAPSSFPPTQGGTTAYVKVTDSVSHQVAIATILIPAQSLIITPPSATLSVGQTLQLRANVTGVTWSVDLGSITSDGLYTPLTIDQKNLLPPQYTSNSVSATVTARLNDSVATTVVTTVYPADTVNDALVKALLRSFIGSSNITQIGTLTSGSIPTSLLTGPFPASSVTGLAFSALTDTTNAGNITSGTLDVHRLPTNIPASSITGLPTTTDAGNITTGTLNANRLPTNIPVTSIAGLSGTPYQADITGTSISIPASTHGRGTFPVMRVYSGGIQIPVEYLVNGSGDITATNLPSATYHVAIVSGDNLATSYEADFSSVTSISVPASAHRRGTFPTVALFSSGVGIVAFPSVNMSGDISFSSLSLGNYHIKIF